MEFPPYLREIKVVSFKGEYGLTIPLHVRVIACTSLLDLARVFTRVLFLPAFYAGARTAQKAIC